MQVHGISEADWPDFRRLMQWWKRNQQAEPIAGKADLPPPELVTVILNETLTPGEEVKARRVVPGHNYTQDVFAYDLTTGSFQIVIGNEDGIQYTTPTIHASEDEERVPDLLQASPLGEYLADVQLTNNKRRYKIVYNRDIRPPVYILPDINQPRLFVTESRLVENGEEYTVHAGVPYSQNIPAGTMCQVQFVLGIGWTITEFENLADFNVDTIIQHPAYSLGNCTRQLIPYGSSSACTLFNSGDTPSGFLANYNDILVELQHTGGCRFESDYFLDDSLYMVLDFYDVANVGPTARLQVLGKDNSLYGDNIEIIYWNDHPADALSVNRLMRITHLSEGNAQIARRDTPACITVRPYSQTCFDYSIADLNKDIYGPGLICAEFFEVEIHVGQEFRLTAGPRQPNTDLNADEPGCEVGCVWHSLTTNEGEIGFEHLTVEYTRTVCGDAVGWKVTAIINIGLTVARYELERLTDDVQDEPDCRDLQLELESLTDPYDTEPLWPATITLKRFTH